MTVPTIVATATPQFGRGMPGETVVLGPSLGTSTAVWDRPLRALSNGHPLLAWDLPGHGLSPAATAPFTADEIADGVLRCADEAGLRTFAYAGVSLGGLIGVALALRAPERVTSLTLVCSLPRIGTAEGWAERAAAVRASGTASLVTGSASRWFAPGFIEAEPIVAAKLLNQLLDIDDESYALCVEMLGATDLRDRVATLPMPITLVEGELDVVIGLEDAAAAARSAQHGALHVLPGIAHLGPVEAPDAVAGFVLAAVEGRSDAE